jgi:hypothetical protein
MRYMLTLTFPAPGQHDYSASVLLVMEWLRRDGRRLLGGRYIGFPELHPHGHGWHWHVLTDERLRVNLLRESWTRWLASKGMNPSGGALWVRIDAKDWGDGRRAARYAAKYVTKKCEVPPGRHRYLMSDAAQPVVPVVGIVPADTMGEVLRQLIDWGLPTGPGVWLMLADDATKDWYGPPLLIARWD